MVLSVRLDHFFSFSNVFNKFQPRLFKFFAVSNFNALHWQCQAAVARAFPNRPPNSQSHSAKVSENRSQTTKVKRTWRLLADETMKATKGILFVALALAVGVDCLKVSHGTSDADLTRLTIVFSFWTAGGVFDRRSCESDRQFFF